MPRGRHQNSLDNLLKSPRRGRRPKPIIDGKMQCCRCRSWKPLDEFNRKGRLLTGYASTCSQCKIDHINNRYATDILFVARRIHKAHKAQHNTRSKARKNLAATSQITAQDIVDMWNSQNGLCAVTGRKMTHIYGSGAAIPTNASIDRIDNSIGYEPGNVRLVCKAVNYMKHCMTDAELLDWCQAVLVGKISPRLG